MHILALQPNLMTAPSVNQSTLMAGYLRNTTTQAAVSPRMPWRPPAWPR